MFQITKKITFHTHGKDLLDITPTIVDFINLSNVFNGIVNISILHTSASLLIQENADQLVKKDIMTYFDKICPESKDYFHNQEGSDDMPAHLKTILTQTNLTLSIIKKKIVLGTWQGIFIFEHRNCYAQRDLLVHIIGET